MESHERKAIIEAMIFVAEEPLDERAILMALEGSDVTLEMVRATIAEIEMQWNSDPSHGMRLIPVAGGYQFRTKESCAHWLQHLNLPKAVRLSPAALETLAIIAYRQPCIRAEVEGVRGVDSGGVLRTLLERRLIKIIGRRDDVGQPLIYATTKEFLELFNLKDLKDLPALKDVQELALQRQVATDEGTSDTEVPLEAQGKRDDDDDDNDEDDEEDTEVIERDEDDEEEDDEEALASLEAQIKDVQRLEKVVFPKQVKEGGVVDGLQSRTVEGRGEIGSPQRESSPGEEALHHAGQEGADASGLDEAPSPDRPVQ